MADYKDLSNIPLHLGPFKIAAPHVIVQYPVIALMMYVSFPAKSLNTELMGDQT